jgi:hypothetical protein
MRFSGRRANRRHCGELIWFTVFVRTESPEPNGASRLIAGKSLTLFAAEKLGHRAQEIN